jgi:hypothetical protein
MGEKDTVHKRMHEDEAEYSPSGGDNKEKDDNDDELESYHDNDGDELERRGRQAKAEAIMKLAAEALTDPSPLTGHCTDIYGHSQQYYLHQKNYVDFLQKLLSDTIRFPGFPKDSDGKVIVDTHPDYAPLRTDEVIGDNKFQGTILQCGPIFEEDGKASCFTFEQMLQSLRWRPQVLNPYH